MAEESGLPQSAAQGKVSSDPIYPSASSAIWKPGMAEESGLPQSAAQGKVSSDPIYLNLLNDDDYVELGGDVPNRAVL